MYRSASGTYLMTGTMINNDKQPNIMGKAMACELADIVGYGESLARGGCVGVGVVLGTFALHLNAARRTHTSATTEGKEKAAIR